MACFPRVCSYDLAPDGMRLAAFLPDDKLAEKLPTHLKFQLNFFDELRRKASSGWESNRLYRPEFG